MSRSTPLPPTTATTATACPPRLDPECLHEAGQRGDQRLHHLVGLGVASGEHLADLHGNSAPDGRSETTRATVGEPDLEGQVEDDPLRVEQARDVSGFEVEQQAAWLGTEGLHAFLNLHDLLDDAGPGLSAVQECRQLLVERRRSASFTVTVDSRKVAASHARCTDAMKKVHEVVSR